MKLLVNLLIMVLIAGYAVYMIVKNFKRSKQGKCAACDYDCEIKKQLSKRKKKII